MTQLVHYEVEIFYATTYRLACGAEYRVGNATTDDSQVTCQKCLKEMGYGCRGDEGTNHNSTQISANKSSQSSASNTNDSRNERAADI